MPEVSCLIQALKAAPASGSTDPWVSAVLAVGSSSTACAHRRRSLPDRGTIGQVSQQHPVPGSTDEYLASVDPVVLADRMELSTYRTWLIELPGIREAGYVCGINDAEGKATTLLWAGESHFHDIARTEAARRGIALTIRLVRYSTTQLDDAVNRLLASAGRTGWDSFGITSISGTNATRDGLLVTGEYGTPSEAAQDPRLPRTLAFARTVAPEAVALEIGPAPVPLG